MSLADAGLQRKETLLRGLPAVDELLRREDIAEGSGGLPAPLVVQAIREGLADVRRDVLQGWTSETDVGEAAEAAALRRLEALRQSLLQRVVNGTGVVLHTNLGRAPLSPRAVDAVVAVAEGYSNLEVDRS